MDIGGFLMSWNSCLKRTLCAFLILVMIASCSMEASGPGRVDKAILISESARMIDKHLESVVREMQAHGELEGVENIETITGEEIARSLIKEEKGEEYLNFLYQTPNFETVVDVIAAASDLVPQEQLDEIVTEADKIERALMRMIEDDSRALNEKQQLEFYRDVRKIVVKSVVLLTAALVYAIIPNTIIWGKISAATAVSIAAGVAASAIMRLVECKKSDSTAINQTFQDWLKEMSTEPTTAWAVAAGVINTGKSMGYSPVTTSMILVVFGLYGITDDIKPLLQKYNFKV